MSTLTPFPVLALIGAVSGAVTAWLLLRRDRPAEVLTPTAPPERVDEEVELQLLADQRAVHLAVLRDFATAADDDPDLRQNCVDEVLAQFRYGSTGLEDWHAALWQLLLPRLRPGHPGFWPGMDLHGEACTMAAVDLRGCELRDATFPRVRFVGDAHFEGAVFTGSVSFVGAYFAEEACFDGAEFRGPADFAGAVFGGPASFRRLAVHDLLWFDLASFCVRADFTGTDFAEVVSFDRATFAGETRFLGTRFTEARFTRTRFGGDTDFTGASAERFGFAGTRIRTDVPAARSWPPGWTPGTSRPWAALREVPG